MNRRDIATMKQDTAIKDSGPMNDFRRCTEGIIDDFLAKQNRLIYPHLKIRPDFHADRDAYENNSKRAFAGPVFIEKSEEEFMLHLCEERLQALALPTLQGWLTHHAVMCIPKQHPEFYSCNFLEKIFPTMPVTGLATNHILQVVTHLERALQHYMAAKSLIDLGYGMSACHFYFSKVHVDPEDFESYNLFMPYGWSRSLFLCRILEDYMGIYALVRQGDQLSMDLETFWLNIHNYLIPSDLDLMQDICRIPALQNGKEYCDKVIEMFKVVRDTLLEPETGDAAARPLLVR
jgi:hypothetical protein